MTVGKIYNNLKKKPVMGVSEYGCPERKLRKGKTTRRKQIKILQSEMATMKT
jgi:hypothetical protein